MEGPSSMMTTDNIENKPKMGSGRVFLFLDYDGSLVPLVDIPRRGLRYHSPDSINPVEDLKSKGIIDAGPDERSSGYYGEHTNIFSGPLRSTAENITNKYPEYYPYGPFPADESRRAADPTAHVSQIFAGNAGAHIVSGMNPPPYANTDDLEGGFASLILEKEWHDYIKEAKKNIVDDMWKNSAIVNTTMGIAGQAAAGLLVHGLSDPDLPLWAKNAIKISVGVGLGATAAGLGMRGLKRLVRRILIKTGAISTASGIILPIAMSFPTVAAWTVGAVAWSVVATSVTLA